MPSLTSSGLVAPPAEAPGSNVKARGFSDLDVLGQSLLQQNLPTETTIIPPRSVSPT